jgi:branched-chain amino acid transport system ATP-binding protein
MARETVPLIETAALTMRFGGVVAVSAVNFRLEESELRCLIGPNGAGKSTFFKCLTGQYRPSAGTVKFRGHDITGALTHDIARLGLGIKTQIPNVFNGLDVRENIRLAAARRGKTRAAVNRLIDEVVTRVGIADLTGRIVGKLAHGQRQLVELATVLAGEPQVILLDEPAAGMTNEETARTAAIIKEINPLDRPHRRRARHAVRQDDRAQGHRFPPGRHPGGSADRRDSVEPNRARRLSRQEDRRLSLLDVTGLKSGYGSVPILAGISISVEAGEFVGILGHNCMGMTTLLRTLMGYLPATEGSIKFDGQDVTRLATHQRARRGLGLVPQGREIFPTLTVRDNLRMGFALSKGDETAAIDAVLADFPRLERLLDRPGGALSGGEQQLLALARCLCADPRLVLLDEPTEGIQPSIIDEIIDTLTALTRKRPGFTIVLVEQNLDFIAALSERVMVIQKGAITREIAAAELSDIEIVGEFVGFAH